VINIERQQSKFIQKNFLIKQKL